MEGECCVVDVKYSYDYIYAHACLLGITAEAKRGCFSRLDNRVQINKALLLGATQTRSVLLLSTAAVLEILCNIQHAS